MDLTQKKIADIFGCDTQTVARWEKSGRVNKPADRFIRYLFLGVSVATSAEKIVTNLCDSRTKVSLELDNSDWSFEPQNCEHATA